MNEIQAILEAWRNTNADLEEAVLASVMDVQGSAYRRPGARMLIERDGRHIGTLSGGCLEREVSRKAGWWTARGGVALRTFDTSSEDAAWDFGLGCNGVVTVLLEQVTTAAVREMLGFLERELAHAGEAVVATVFRADPGSSQQPGDRLLWTQQGAAGGALRRTSLANDLTPLMGRALGERTQRAVRLSDVDVLVEWVGLPPRLVVFGAGHDVLPLVSMAAILGWRITVADPRASYAQTDRFPGAERVLCLDSTGDVAEITIDADTAVVMMTHNFPLDRLLLPQILERRPKYLGLLGPRRRTERLFEGSRWTAAEAGVHAPTGLDIGGDHPETIALSILAEAQAVLAGRAGGSLRERQGPIHGPVEHLNTSNRSRAHRESERVQPLCEVGAAYSRG